MWISKYILRQINERLEAVEQAAAYRIYNDPYSHDVPVNKVVRAMADHLKLTITKPYRGYMPELEVTSEEGPK